MFPRSTRTRVKFQRAVISTQYFFLTARHLGSAVKEAILAAVSLRNGSD
jgi:hypothetical protein